MRKHFSLTLLISLLGIVLFVAPFPASARRAGLPANAYVYGVVGYPHTYTLSCESRSAVDWARFWGVNIGESEFLNLLPRSDNPNAGFVGDPNDAWGATPPASYGVHARPVADLLMAYEVEAHARRGMSWDDLRREIAEGRPVIVWVIGAMWNGSGYDYTARDGETVRVAAFEHSMILVGYDEKWVYAIDANTGWTQSYSAEGFQRSWGVLGNMAVTGAALEEPEPAPEQSRPEGNTYTVQRGDYLVALAGEFGLEWQELAELNEIYYPFTLFPGQTLKLPETEAPEEKPPEKPSPPLTHTPVPPTPGPTATPAVYAFLVLDKPQILFLPVVAQQGSMDASPPEEDQVTAVGVCLYTQKGVLYIKPLSFFRGLCISPALLRPEHLMGLAGGIPELP